MIFFLEALKAWSGITAGVFTLGLIEDIINHKRNPGDSVVGFCALLWALIWPLHLFHQAQGTLSLFVTLVRK